MVTCEDEYLYNKAIAPHRYAVFDVDLQRLKALPKPTYQQGKGIVNAKPSLIFAIYLLTSLLRSSDSLDQGYPRFHCLFPTLSARLRVPCVGGDNRDAEAS